MMKLVVKGYKEDIEAFKEMLITNDTCPFVNNSDVSCLDASTTCEECVELHIDFIENARCEE